MGNGVAWWQILAVVAIVGACYRPLGEYMARVYTATRHTRAESAIYRLCRIDPDADQEWPHYLRALLAFSAVGILLLYAILRLQSHLPFATGHSGVSPALSFNTAVSFVSNTSWQNYPGESTLGHTALAAGLGVAAFSSAAVGMAAGVALVRGLVRQRRAAIGNFWVDLVRGSLRILLPLSAFLAVILVALGVIQNLHGVTSSTSLAGTHPSLPGGPVASWEPIKLLSGDGGGALNANSAHPFENPGPVSNVLEISMMLLIPVAFIRTIGRLIGNQRPAWALLLRPQCSTPEVSPRRPRRRWRIPVSSLRRSARRPKGRRPASGCSPARPSGLPPLLRRTALLTRATTASPAWPGEC
jgi:K+-transporting ATPase ATPase A chain